MINYNKNNNLTNYLKNKLKISKMRVNLYKKNKNKFISRILLTKIKNYKINFRNKSKYISIQ